MQHYVWVADRHDAMQKMLTDPNLLADWTLKMLGDGGVYDPQAQVQGQQIQGQVRPVFPGNPSPGRAANSSTRWEAFDQLVDQDPTQAWRYVDQMTPQDFQARPMFVVS